MAVLTFAVASGQAQVLPLPPQNPPRSTSGPQAPPSFLSAPGFVSTYEIVRTLRAAGFDPLAPPLREGTIYVARATDYRGIPMRVVLDARTGAIRDANRIVPGPGNYGGPSGPYGEADEPYGGPVYGPGPYGPPDPYEPDGYGPGAYGRVGALPPSDDTPPVAAPSAALPAAPAHAASRASGPPLPRPRPPELAARQPLAGVKPAAASDSKPAVADDAKSAATKPGATKPDATKPDAISSAPPAASPLAIPPAAAAPPAGPAQSRQTPSTLTINN